MKHNFFRVLSLIAAIILLMSAAACSGKKQEDSSAVSKTSAKSSSQAVLSEDEVSDISDVSSPDTSQATSSTSRASSAAKSSKASSSGSSASAPSNTGITFPLKNPVTFTFMLSGNETATFKSDLEKNKLWQKLKKDTNVNATFQFLGTNSVKLTTLMAGKSYGDVIYGNTYDSAEISQYIAARKLKDLTPYINSKYMPNLSKQMNEIPASKNMITAADGKIYTIPKITGLEGHYLESPIWINKKWLDKLNLQVPSTLDQLTNVLRAFRDQDPNGNGVQDEIPYITSSSHAYMHTEALLGMWGLATKDSALDSFVQVVNKKVVFVPSQPAYKEALKYLSVLYGEALMWQEAFTANTNTLNAKLLSPTPVVGMFTSPTPAPTDYSGDYIVIPPPKVTGYTTKWYYHPAINGSKNQFFVTDKCKNVDILMVWMDQFYDLDIAMANDHGLPGEGRIQKGADGKYSFIEMSDTQGRQLDLSNPTLTTIMRNNIRGIPASAYKNSINLSKDEAIQQNSYQLYKPYLNTELWPRPYHAVADAYEVAALTTDIFNLVSNNQARWVTGKADIDAQWNDYLKQLNNMRLNDYVKILQRSYDTYLKGAK